MEGKAKVALTFALYQGDQLVRRDTIAQDIVKVGKDPRSHLRVDDDLASRMHAVIEVAGKSVAFVRVAPEEFELHEVTVGESAAGKVRVLSGLREGEEVVVEGAFTVKSVILRGTLADED